MKHFILFILFTAASFISKGDSGNAYVLQVEVKYDKGIAKGYIWLGGYIEIDSAREAFYKKNSMLFTSYVKQELYKDSLSVHKDVFEIDSLYINIFFNDRIVKIDTSKIRSIKLKSVKEDLISSVISKERFSVKDLSWLKKPFLYKEEYSTEGCNHYLYFFETPKTIHPFVKKKKQYLDKGLENLTEEELMEFNKLLVDYIESFNKSKVLVRSICGC